MACTEVRQRVAKIFLTIADDQEADGERYFAIVSRLMGMKVQRELLEKVGISDSLALARRDELRFDLARREVALCEEALTLSSIEDLIIDEESLREARARLAALSPL